MKLTARQKDALSRLLPKIENSPVAVVTGDVPEKHIVISRLARNHGPILVLTDRGAYPKILKQYQRSLGEEDHGKLYEVRTLQGPLGHHQIEPKLIVIDVRRENLEQTGKFAAKIKGENCKVLIWDYDTETHLPAQLERTTI